MGNRHGASSRDRTTVAEAAKKNKVREPTIYAWRKHFSELGAVDVKRRRAFRRTISSNGAVWGR